MADEIRIVEVGPRDGLQNEAKFVPTPIKLRLIERLQAAGLEEMEVTSFVSPKWVPQLADAEELSSEMALLPTYSALVPNARGLERAIACGYRRIAVFTAASETFCLRNINMSVERSIEVFRDLIQTYRARVPAGTVRAYVSTAFECPYEGRVAPSTVLEVMDRLLRLEVDEISVGDTLGVAGPSEVKILCREIDRQFGLKRVALHFHDTRGTAVANVAAALEEGVRIFDSSAGGLGGCPYAPGAGGNLATEDLIYFLNREGFRPRSRLDEVAAASLEVLAFLAKIPSAKAQVASLAAGRA